VTHAIELTVSIFLLVLGTSYLLQAKHWIQFLSDSIQRPSRLFPTALAMLASGVFIGTVYDNWSSTWPIFISTIAWLMALEGALILIFPGFLKRLENTPERFLTWYLRGGGLLLMVLGALLLQV
jgi:uncharacterized protein YjeT (DUF2065 family)